MKYIEEINLSNFKFWSGAKSRANMFTESQLDEIGENLEKLFGEEIPTATEINDLFWYDVKTVAKLVGVRLDEDENVIDDVEKWAHDFVKCEYPCVVDDYFDSFWNDYENDSSEWESKREVIEAFSEWLNDNWLDHADEVLDNRFPDVSDDMKDHFACELWQNCDSDDSNCFEFEKYLEYQNESNE